MTWTYSAPSASQQDEVRFLLGDTIASQPQLQDEEIAWALGTYSDSTLCARFLCRRLIARYARLVNQSGDGLSKSLGDRYRHYQDLLRELTAELAETSSPVPYCGGISEADKLAALQDDDLVQPFFTRDMMNAPGALPQALDTPYGLTTP